MATTYAVRRTHSVLFQAFSVLCRATKEALNIHCGSQLCHSYHSLIDHLSSSRATSVPSPSTNVSAVTYGMMQKICIVHQHQG
jgi:hypothetical protein